MISEDNGQKLKKIKKDLTLVYTFVIIYIQTKNNLGLVINLKRDQYGK